MGVPRVLGDLKDPYERLMSHKVKIGTSSHCKEISLRILANCTGTGGGISGKLVRFLNRLIAFKDTHMWLDDAKAKEIFGKLAGDNQQTLKEIASQFKQFADQMERFEPVAEWDPTKQVSINFVNAKNIEQCSKRVDVLADLILLQEPAGLPLPQIHAAKETIAKVLQHIHHGQMLGDYLNALDPMHILEGPKKPLAQSLKAYLKENSVTDKEPSKIKQLYPNFVKKISSQIASNNIDPLVFNHILADQTLPKLISEKKNLEALRKIDPHQVLSDPGSALCAAFEDFLLANGYSLNSETIDLYYQAFIDYLTMEIDQGNDVERDDDNFPLKAEGEKKARPEKLYLFQHLTKEVLDYKKLRNTSLSEDAKANVIDTAKQRLQELDAPQLRREISRLHQNLLKARAAIDQTQKKLRENYNELGIEIRKVDSKLGEEYFKAKGIEEKLKVLEKFNLKAVHQIDLEQVFDFFNAKDHEAKMKVGEKFKPKSANPILKNLNPHGFAPQLFNIDSQTEKLNAQRQVVRDLLAPNAGDIIAVARAKEVLNRRHYLFLQEKSNTRLRVHEQVKLRTLYEGTHEMVEGVPREQFKDSEVPTVLSKKTEKNSPVLEDVQTCKAFLLANLGLSTFINRLRQAHNPKHMLKATQAIDQKLKEQENDSPAMREAKQQIKKDLPDFIVCLLDENS